MSSHVELVPANALNNAPASPGNAGGLQAPAPLDPYRLARRALRGRYLVAILLGLLGGTIGALVGWKRGGAVYRSEGLIQIAYSRPSILRPADQSPVPLEVIQVLLQSQQAVLSSRRLVDLALQEPAWVSTGRGASPAVVAEFASNLKVEYRFNTDYLRVLYTDQKPAVAAAAVQSIIRAYVRLCNSQDNYLQQQRLQVLQSRRAALAETLDQLHRQIEAITREVGPADIDRLQEATVTRVATLQSMLTDIGMALVLAQGQKTSPLTNEQIAVMDPAMRDYMAHRNRLEDELAQLKLRGLGEKHPQILQTQAALASVNERIETHAGEFRKLQSATLRSSTGGGERGPSLLGGQSIESLQNQEAAVRDMYEQARQDMLTLGQRRVQLQNLKAQAADAEREYASVTQHRDLLQVESSLGGMLNVISEGEAPTAPSQDRRLPMAGMGAVAGAGFPVALLLMVGLLSTRYRYSDETEADLAVHAPLLGILPMLPEGLEEPDRAADAAQCVHQIRAMLQITNPSKTAPVYLLSSASPGEGKTSLTAALGLSFAASGSKTLVIDCDLVGQGLSAGFEGEKSTGVREALDSGDLGPHVKKTIHKGLFILPVGRADLFEGTALSWSALQRLLDEARRCFDVILVDSGPILGSVEASLIAPQTDGVIFVIARRQQRSLVEKAMRQLRVIGAKTAGMVFNRAEPTDFYESVQMTSMCVGSTRRSVSRPSRVSLEEPSTLGPVVRSVESFLPPASGNGQSQP